tara:strand:+ start:155 stop:1306 length:1152 start_codon:yes stop_codon:yes gene_type:complete
MNKKRILFVTTRSPFSPIFSGDRQRAKTIIKHLSKKNKVDVLYSDNIGNEKNGKIKSFFFKTNLFDKINGIILSLIKLEPLQLGYFFSKSLKNFLDENHARYNTVIFHLIRSAQYLPKNYRGKKILEMTDLISKNYGQVIKNFSTFNPVRYVYLIEKLLVKNYEFKCIQNFDKIVLASKNDLKKTEIKNTKKFIEVSNTIEINKNIYKFKNSNFKILFVGNINYLPNRKACKDFAVNILPEINKIYSNIEFHIIGQIKIIDKIFFKNIKNTYTHGMVKKIDTFVKNSICGICNVEIATGTQMKMLTYMSNGLPCVASFLSSENTSFKKNKEVLVYNNNREFVNIIKKLKENKKFSNKISRHSYLGFKKKCNKNKILSIYDKII